MIDKNGRLFSKVSIIDLLIVVLVLVLAVGLIFRKETQPVINGNANFKVVIKIEDIRQYTVDAIQIGDKFYEQYANEIGTVSNIEVSGATELMENNKGEAFLAPLQDRYDLAVTLDCTGRITDTGYYANGNRQLSIGGDVPVQSTYVYTNSRIIDIYEE